MQQNFEELFEKAAQVHGHKCPSLFYGVSFGLLACREHDGDTRQIILEGSSKCIRDGISSVLQESAIHAKIKIISNPPVCALTLADDRNIRRFILSPLVRQQINRWNKELPLEEFQRQGVEYLRTLKTEELFLTEPISREEFENLCKRT
ncbi:MAG: hypothetical protein HZA78_12255 [Candidatus Schekmanbacteria bacterium]|nr:hypothetical protein [Candidatus Schekmanbacteria bacterium]